jgi:hypothetical protein
MPLRRKREGRRRTEARLPLFAVLLLFAFAAVYTSLLTIQQDATVNSLVRYDDAFDAAQGTVELLRLQDAVAEYALGAPDVTADIVNLRFEILQNRFQVLNRPSFVQAVSGHVETDGVVQDLSDALSQTQALLPRLSEKGVPQQIIAALSPLDSEMTLLMSITSTIVGRGSTLSRRR